MSKQQVFVGIDFGTSGCRACAINTQSQILAEVQLKLPAPERRGVKVEQNPWLWWQALQNILTQLCDMLRHPITAISIDATSATLLLADKQGTPLTPALMYNDARAIAESEQIHKLAPTNTGANGASSSLAKLLWLLNNTHSNAVCYALHQADWLAGKLTGQFGISDENNCLKMGYDSFERKWPNWISGLGFDLSYLPQVQAPGTGISTMKKETARQLGLSTEPLIVSGTTDSIAAFLATGANQVGDAVTSLGSTLAIKIVSQQPVFSSKYGIYSHRLWNKWLAGGASNTGGAVLLKYFTPDQLNAMTANLAPETPTKLEYYPLLSVGERFPIADAKLKPNLEPRPTNDLIFFQAMLESMARIEAEAYKRLQSLGAPYPKVVYTVGGGAKNAAWSQIRQQTCGVEMRKLQQLEAAYGAALLARRGVYRL
jgi:sugar (pentulose or hexulose) kinase